MSIEYQTLNSFKLRNQFKLSKD